MCFIATQAPVTGSAPRPEDEETRPKFSVHNDHTAFSHALLHAGLYGILGDGLSAKDESIFWTRYQPPHVVKDNRDVTDPILLEIITSSIVNIKARIFECYRRRPTLFREVAAAAWLGVAEEEAARYDGQEDDAIEEDTESCIPIIVPPESSSKRKRTRGSIYRPLPIDECGYRRSSLPVDAAYHAVVARISDKLRGTALATGEPHLIPEPGPEPGPGPGPEPEPEPMEQVECVSCLDKLPVTGVIKLTCHSYCPECFQRLIATACEHEQSWPATCCLNEIPACTILSNLPHDSELYDIFRARCVEWNTRPAHRIYCSHPSCRLFVPPANIDPATRTARCPAGHATCTLCREPQHPSTTACRLDGDAALTEALAQEEGWVHCARCRALVEHRDGCEHMICRCGYQFCYVCAAPWREPRSCRCTTTDLVLKKAAAAARREARIRREEAELRDALRQIEEFEREEARKAELLRREEQERREAMRRRLVEARFAELRDTLDRLGSEYRQLLRQHHVRESEAARREGDTARYRLDAEHVARSAELVAATEAHLVKRVVAVRIEHAARLYAERAFESDYQRQLEGFYAALHVEDPTAADDAIASAKEELRCNLDQSWHTWIRWRDHELAALEARAEEERAIREECLDAAHRRLEERLAADAREMARRHAAERYWLEVVAAERAEMLEEWEAREMEEGRGAVVEFSDEEPNNGSTVVMATNGSTNLGTEMTEVTRPTPPLPLPPPLSIPSSGINETVVCEVDS